MTEYCYTYSREKQIPIFKLLDTDCIVSLVAPGAKLLEVAMGTGYPVADMLEKRGHEVHGVDLSPQLLEKCRALNSRIICTVGDAEKLAYADDTFDAVCCLNSTSAWRYIIIETPAFPGEICSFLKESSVNDFYLMVMNEDGSLQKTDSLAKYPRVVFIIEK